MKGNTSWPRDLPFKNNFVPCVDTRYISGMVVQCGITEYLQLLRMEGRSSGTCRRKDTERIAYVLCKASLEEHKHEYRPASGHDECCIRMDAMFLSRRFVVFCSFRNQWWKGLIHVRYIYVYFIIDYPDKPCIWRISCSDNFLLHVIGL